MADCGSVGGSSWRGGMDGEDEVTEAWDQEGEWVVVEVGGVVFYRGDWVVPAV